MTKTRLEAFSDGVIAILITVMLFDVKPPAGADLSAIQSVLPVVATYLLSFLYLGIYWNNHHHLLATAQRINGSVLWANLHLLFWLSLLPFATNWLRSTGFQQLPTAVYGIVLLVTALGYKILQTRLIRVPGQCSALQEAIGADWKGKLSIGLYVFGVAASLIDTRVALGLYVLVALMWLVPDPRIEARISH
jgi:uncharacterized membrane protein